MVGHGWSMNTKKKGLDYERKVAKDLRDRGIFPECQRSRQQDDKLGIDLERTDSFAFQIKRKKNHVSINTIKEIKPKNDCRPVLISRADNDKAYAVIEYDTLIYLLECMKHERTLRKVFFDGRNS